MNGIEGWVERVLSASEATFVAVPAALLLGISGALASCCTLPALGAVAGYSAAHGDNGRKGLFIAPLAFFAGTSLALIAAGIVAGYAGQVSAGVMGRHWKMLAGLASVLFGATALKLVPFRIPAIPIPAGRIAGGAAAFGLIVGGATTACAITCNPVLAVFLGMTFLKGKVLWGALVLGAFAVGYSLPLAALIAGISAGKSAMGSKWIPGIVEKAGGLILIALGFYLLATF